MLPTIHAAAIGVLQKPHFQCASRGIEFSHVSENIEEYDLNHVLCFRLVLHNANRNAGT
jgi:hypothetical protein